MYRLGRWILPIGASLLPFVHPVFGKGVGRVLREKEIIWRRVMDDNSFEHAKVRPGPLGPSFGGTILIAEKGYPLRIDYHVDCDEGWRTRRVELTQSYLGTTGSVLLEHDGLGIWRRDGQLAPGLSGCTDVDLGVSPSTNALPVNRLRLIKGRSEIIRAAWVRFPSLEIEVAEQSYKCLDEGRYLYCSLSSGFQAEVQVDEDGFPTDYAGVWQRLAEGQPARQSSGILGISGFSGALLSPGPAPDMFDVAADFGWLVGGWEAEVFDHNKDGTVRTGSGEWWFSWVLEGRAIQDVWISPPRCARGANVERQAASDRYGTSLRHFDREAGIWRIAWTNPVSGAVNHLSGTRVGNRIVLTAKENGETIRWSFNDISNDSFVWLGERQANGKSWCKEAEFRLRRIAS